MLRRAFGMPQRNDAAPVPPQASRFERYELGARLYHWGNLFIILGLVVSGASFFFPGSLFALLPVLGVSWLTFHVVLARLFVLGFFAHIVAAIGWGDLWSMWFERRDWRDLIAWTRYYLGQDVAIPKTGKYDVIQKIYHFCLAALQSDPVPVAGIHRNVHRQDRARRISKAIRLASLAPKPFFAQKRAERQSVGKSPASRKHYLLCNFT